MQRPRLVLGLLMLVTCVGLRAFAMQSSVPTAAQEAVLIGTVLDDATERPIANAEIVLTTLNRTVRSDSAGNFVVDAIPAGVHRVLVRALGREPLTDTIAFGTDGRVERDYLLAAAASANTLEQVDVTADASLESIRLADFNARRALGHGRFLTQDVMEQANGRTLSDVLTSRIPGLRSMPIGGGQRAMASTRGPPSRRGPPACYVQVIVDGMVRYNGIRPEPFDINSMDPTIIAGIEYFTTSQTPAQFNGTGTPCGTLLIWTRGR